ncbi:MAG: SDR family oxidoreductase [Pseudomonadota bacterium]
MDLGIAGKKAIVCAASRGLGRACAHALADAGVNLVINSATQANLDKTAAELRQKDVDVIAIAGDISQASVQDELVSAAGEVDILVNNNGGPPLKDFRQLDRDAIAKGVEQNMITPIELVQKVIDGMAERGFGRIVNITSTSVYQPIPGLDLSSGARAGLTSFLAGVASTYAAKNVTINQLLPGKFDTDRIRKTIEFAAEKNGVDFDTQKQTVMNTIAAKRLGDPTEFGATCAFLCSTHAGYLTGRNIILDGGVFASAF